MNDKGPMDQFSAHLDRAWDLVTRGDYAGAMLSAQKSLDLDQQSPEVHHLLGYIHAAEGHAEEALEQYKQALELDETFVEAMLDAAEILIHPVHDFDGALKLVDDALELAEDDEEVADAMLLRVDAFLHQGDKVQAAEALRRMPDGPFESGQIEFRVGRAQFDCGNLDKAEQHLLRAIEKEAQNPEAHYFLGLLYESKANKSASVIAFLNARDLDLRLPRPPWALSREQFEKCVRDALHRLSPEMAAVLEGALVVVSDAPGAEIVCEGVDPRIAAFLDEPSAEGLPYKAGRLFVYQRNLERMSVGLAECEDEILVSIEREIGAAFPPLAKPEPESDEPESHR